MPARSLFIAILVIAIVISFGSNLGFGAPPAVEGSPALVAPIVKPVSNGASEAPSPALTRDSQPLHIVIDDGNGWSAEELALVNKAIADTYAALAQLELDPQALFADYQIRRYIGEYVNGKPGSIGQVDHEAHAITLSDTAFIRLWGFYIYHELGHVLDRRTDRQLSNEFHRLAGSTSGSEESPWQTADGFWLRDQGHHDREEATADAFALWVIDQAGIKRPVFGGMPLDVDYEGINSAVREGLGNLELP